MWKATRPAYQSDDDQSPYWWASLDGETWVEVSREPTPGDEAAVAALFEPEVSVDSSGREIRSYHLTWARRRLVMSVADVVIEEV